MSKIYIPAEIVKVNPGLTDEELNAYIDQVWKLLSGMVPGDVIVVEVTAKKYPELFIECAKCYMREHSINYQDGLSFADGYKELRKYDLTWVKRPLRPSATSPEGEEISEQKLNQAS